MTRPTLLNLLWLLPVVGLAVAWFFLLRPDFMGGPAAYIIVSGESMKPGLSSGDLAVMRRQSEYGPGDVVVFGVGGGGAVIHRIVDGNAEEGFVTQGDNLERPDLWRPTPDEIGGKMWFSIPAGGRLITLLQNPFVLATLAGLLAVFSVAGGGGRKSGGWQRERERRLSSRGQSGLAFPSLRWLTVFAVVSSLGLVLTRIRWRFREGG